jgi:hypothetical protein
MKRQTEEEEREEDAKAKESKHRQKVFFKSNAFHGTSN